MAKRLSVIDNNLCVGCQSCMFACTRRFAEGGLGKSCIHIHSAGGIDKGFVVIVCRVCPTDALAVREGGGVRLDAAKCIGCGNCANACPFGAARWDGEQNKPAICIYCGYCAPFCPYSVIALQEMAEVQDGR
jgi:Fe-S-cluster-containing dehydrogenase component